jgi:hypothetical protein
MTGSTMLFRVIQGILVVVNADVSPSDEDYDAYVEFIAKEMPKTVSRCLVVSAGGAPNARQRERSNQMLRERGLSQAKVAVVTNSLMVRGVVTALSWFNPQMKAFSELDLQGALKYLDSIPAQRGAIGVEVRMMQAQMTSKKRPPR